MFLLLLIYFFSQSTKLVYSISEFTLQKQITYQIDSQANAKVDQLINLQNNFSTIYAKEYNLTIDKLNIKDVTATDNLGNILKSVKQKDDQTTISLQFNQPTTNKNNTTNFSVSYHIDNFAVNQGSIWKIDLPQHPSSIQDQVSITLKVPISFGKLAYSSISVNPQIEGNYQLIQIPQRLASKNISFAFGQTQLFNFTINYFLSNDQDQAQILSIPILPDTATQDVIFTTIDPKPQNITIDDDGNFLAQYKLDAHQSFDIYTSGQIQVHSPNSSFPTTSPDSYNILPQQFWPTTNQTITSISSKLNTPRQIYDYVLDKLDYNFDQIENAHRKSPLDSLNQPQNSLCTDFTDLFITLARSISIPSREIQGIVYTTNPKLLTKNIKGDLLHAWPQFWNNQTNSWQSIDPTWQETTNGTDYFDSIDLNHIVLVIHGKKDQFPLAPGSYKQDSNQKSITLLPTNTAVDKQFQKPQISLNMSILTIQNPNPNTLTSLNVSDTNTNFNHTISLLPPYSSSQLDISKLNQISSALPKNKTISLTLKTDQNQPSQIELINPYHLKYFIIAISSFILLLSLSGVIILKLI